MSCSECEKLNDKIGALQLALRDAVSVLRDYFSSNVIEDAIRRIDNTLQWSLSADDGQ